LLKLSYYDTCLRTMNPRRFRKSRGLTLHEMAELLGAANASTVSKQERGNTFPTPENIERWREISGGKVQYEDFVELRDCHRAPVPMAAE